MNARINSSAFDRAAGPVMQILSRDQAAQIVDFHADAELQERIEELAQKANEGELTDEERSEYLGYSQANKFIAILQIQARQMLDQHDD